MPVQEIFLERSSGEERVVVVKTYDQAFAKEAFDDMDPMAMEVLALSLRLSDLYEDEDVPSPNDIDFPDFLWQTVLDEAREEGQVRSFFVVFREKGNTRKNLLVTPDWPTAKSFASAV